MPADSICLLSICFSSFALLPPTSVLLGRGPRGRKQGAKRALPGCPSLEGNYIQPRPHILLICARDLCADGMYPWFDLKVIIHLLEGNLPLEQRVRFGSVERQGCMLEEEDGGVEEVEWEEGAAAEVLLTLSRGEEPAQPATGRSEVSVVRICLRSAKIRCFQS
eukprot:g36335.t1